MSPDAITIEKDELNQFIGSEADEIAISTEKDETFDLKTGNDILNFSGYFGNDTITLNEGETLNITLPEGYTRTVLGDDVILSSKTNVRYIATMKVEALDGHDTPTLDGYDITPVLNDGILKFGMSMATYVNEHNSQYVHENNFVFVSDFIYDDVGVILTLDRLLSDSDDVFDGAKYSDIHIYQIAGNSAENETKPTMSKEKTE